MTTIELKDIKRLGFVKLCEKKDEYDKIGDEMLQDMNVSYVGTHIRGTLRMNFDADKINGKRQKDINEAMSILTEYLWWRYTLGEILGYIFRIKNSRYNRKEDCL